MNKRIKIFENSDVTVLGTAVNSWMDEMDNNANQESTGTRKVEYKYTICRDISKDRTVFTVIYSKKITEASMGGW